MDRPKGKTLVILEDHPEMQSLYDEFGEIADRLQKEQRELQERGDRSQMEYWTAMVHHLQRLGKVPATATLDDLNLKIRNGAVVQFPRDKDVVPAAAAKFLKELEKLAKDHGGVISDIAEDCAEPDCPVHGHKPPVDA